MTLWRRTGGSKAPAGGEAVLTFPGGRIEPDPAVLPGAVEALNHWSSSADLFARLIPGLEVVPVVVSGDLTFGLAKPPGPSAPPQARPRGHATLQVLVPALRNVDARVEFGRPIHAEPGTVGDAVIEQTRRLMEYEMA